MQLALILGVLHTIVRNGQVPMALFSGKTDPFSAMAARTLVPKLASKMVGFFKQSIPQKVNLKWATHGSTNRELESQSQLGSVHSWASQLLKEFGHTWACLHREALVSRRKPSIVSAAQNCITWVNQQPSSQVRLQGSNGLRFWEVAGASFLRIEICELENPLALTLLLRLSLSSFTQVVQALAIPWRNFDALVFGQRQGNLSSPGRRIGWFHCMVSQCFPWNLCILWYNKMTILGWSQGPQFGHSAMAVVQPATSVDWIRTTSLGLPFRTLFCVLQDRPSSFLLCLFVEDKVWHGHPPLLPGTRSDLLRFKPVAFQACDCHFSKSLRLF